MTVSWDLIRTFEAVARTGSLSGAARTLQMTQPTVGRHVDLLEEKLSMTLFVRGREGMVLTENGAELVATAQSMMQQADSFGRQATGLEESASGTVRIAVNEIFGVLVLPRLLKRFMDSEPAIEIELVVSNRAANLLRRDADIAIRMFRPQQKDLVARKMRELPLGFFAHRKYLADRPRLSSLADLPKHRFIGFERDTSFLQFSERLGIPLAPSDFAFRCDNNLTHVEGIRTGLGVGVTHKGLAENWPDVEEVLPNIALPPLELWLACHEEIRHNRRIRRVMDFLNDALREPYTALNLSSGSDI